MLFNRHIRFPKKKMKIEQVKKIIALKQRQKELASQLEDACKPSYSDIGAIPRIARFLLRDCRLENVSDKNKAVLFVLCALYSPCTLSGLSLKRGMRDSFAESLAVNRGMVSYYLNGLYLYYERYKSFRLEVERLLKQF